MSTSIEMDVYRVNDSIDNIINEIKEFNSNVPLTSNYKASTFNSLKDDGFETDYFTKYDKNVEELSLYLKEYYSAVKNYVETLNNLDDEIGKSIPEMYKVYIDDGPYLGWQCRLINKIKEVTGDVSSINDNSSDAAAALKGSNAQSSSLDSSMITGSQETLTNINNSTAEKSEFDGSNLNVNNVTLTNINKDKSETEESTINASDLNVGSVVLTNIDHGSQTAQDIDVADEIGQTSNSVSLSNISK